MRRAARCAVRSVQVLRPDGSGQAEVHAVDLRPQRILVGPLEDRQDRPEHLFLRQPHVRLHVGEDGRLVEKAILQRGIVRLLG
jgi:hypothetical protein